MRTGETETIDLEIINNSTYFDVDVDCTALIEKERK